jgi:hypothetical protein
MDTGRERCTSAPSACTQAKQERAGAAMMRPMAASTSIPGAAAGKRAARHPAPSNVGRQTTSRQTTHNPPLTCNICAFSIAASSGMAMKARQP